MRPNQTAPDNSRLYGIQIIRAAAAVLVVFTHSITRVSFAVPQKIESSIFKTASGNQWTVGDIGVDLFFVISGFIMVYVHKRDFGQGNASVQFLRKRLLRIFPLYWFLSTVAVGILIFSPELFSYSNKVFDPLWVAGSFLLLPIPDRNGAISPVIGVGWTLIYEMYFYFIFSIALLMDVSMAMRFLFVVISSLVLIGIIFNPLASYLQFATSFLLMNFLGGACVAWIFINGIKVSGRLAIVLFLISASIVSITVYWPPPETGFFRFLFWGIPAILFVTIATYKRYSRSMISSVILILADASYSIYLFQVFVLPIGGKIISNTSLKYLSFDFLVLTMTLFVVSSGLFCWYFIERNLHNIFVWRRVGL